MLNNNIDEARIMLEYSHKEPFLFYRSHIETKHIELKSIPELNIKSDEKNYIKSFTHKEKEIIDYTKHFFKRSELKDSETEIMKLTYILDHLKKKPYILITNNKNYLDNRLRL